MPGRAGRPLLRLCVHVPFCPKAIGTSLIMSPSFVVQNPNPLVIQGKCVLLSHPHPLTTDTAFAR